MGNIKNMAIIVEPNEGVWAIKLDDSSAGRGGFLVLVTAAHFINDLYMMIIPPLLPALMIAFKLSYSIAGILLSIILFVSFVMSLATGYFADAGNRRKSTLASGFILYGVSLLILKVSNDLAFLLMACVVMGVAQATYHPQAVSFINFFIKERRGAALGIHGIGGSIGHFAAPLIVGYLATAMGWNRSLLILFAPPVLMGLILALTLREPAIAPSRGLMKSITFPLIILTITASLRDMIYRGFTSFLPSYFVAKGGTLFQAGMLTALMLVPGLVAQPIGGALSDKIGRKKVFNLTLSMLAASMLGFSFTDGVVSLIFLVLIGFNVFSTFPIALLHASEMVGSNRTGASVGFLFGTSQMIASTAPIILGSIIDIWGFVNAFLVLTIFGGAAFIASLKIPET
ncbi:MAG: MFS transporter [Candidatus Bathyarchaeia archaeon]